MISGSFPGQVLDLSDSTQKFLTVFIWKSSNKLRWGHKTVTEGGALMNKVADGVPSVCSFLVVTQRWHDHALRIYFCRRKSHLNPWHSLAGINGHLCSLTSSSDLFSFIITYYLLSIDFIVSITVAIINFSFKIGLSI